MHVAPHRGVMHWCSFLFLFAVIFLVQIQPPSRGIANGHRKFSSIDFLLHPVRSRFFGSFDIFPPGVLALNRGFHSTLLRYR